MSSSFDAIICRFYGKIKKYIMGTTSSKQYLKSSLPSNNRPLFVRQKRGPGYYLRKLVFPVFPGYYIRPKRDRRQCLSKILRGKQVASHHLNSKSNGPVLLLKTVFMHWNCFLSSVVTDRNDRHELKLENVGPIFLSLNDMLQKSLKITTEVPFLSMNWCFCLFFQIHIIRGSKSQWYTGSRSLHILHSPTTAGLKLMSSFVPEVGRATN